MNKKLAAAMVALLTLGMVGTATAQTLEGDNNVSSSDADNVTSEGSDITVSVSSTTAIDVKPESLDFSNLEVGTQTTSGTNSGNSFGSIEIENIGSEYIDRVWAAATNPSSNPFGTGNPNNYDAGNFLQIKPSNSSAKSSIIGNTTTYNYVNRYEYTNPADSSGDVPSYIMADSADMSSSPQDVQVGRFRAGNEWYFFTILESSSGTCDGSNTGAVLKVGNTSHTPDQFGTVNFEQSGDDYTTYEIAATSGSYGVATNGPSGEIGVRLPMGDGGYREYDVLTKCDTTNPHTVRTRYNPQAGDANDLTAGSETGDRTQFLLRADSSSPSTMLLPGEGLTVDTAIEVPQGVPQGGVQSGSLTFFVTSDADATVN